jgi:hypothetical protein
VEEKTMHTIETVLTVTDKGEILVPAIAALPPGQHKAVLVIEEAPAQQAEDIANPLAGLRAFPLSGWPADATYSRQEIYDDNGR